MPSSINPGVLTTGKLAVGRAATRKNLATDMKVGRKNVFDYSDSTISDGSTDARAAILAADTDGASVLPPGNYAVASNMTLTNNIKLKPGAKLKPASGVTISIPEGYEANDRQKVFDLSAGGTVVVPSSQRFTVNHIGAIGDDSTDNLALFEKAITIAKASGVEIIIPNGTYSLSNKLSVGGATNLAIKGVSTSRSIIKSTLAGIEIGTSDGVSIENLTFQGANEDYAAIKMYVLSNGLDVHHCEFKNWGDTGANVGAIECEDVTGVNISKCKFMDGTGHLNSDIRLTNCSNVVIEGNICLSANGDGITHADTVNTTVGVFSFSGNIIRNKLRHGMLLSYGGTNLRGSVTGNSVNNCKTNGIYLQAANLLGVGDVGEITITGNTVTYCGGEQVADGAGNSGIHIGGNLGGVCCGNIVHRSGYDLTNTLRGTGRGKGIFLSDVENWTISGNTITHSAIHGIGVNHSTVMRNVNIVGNTVIDADEALIYLGEAITGERSVMVNNNTFKCQNKDCDGLYLFETNTTSQIQLTNNTFIGKKAGTGKSAIKWAREKYHQLSFTENKFIDWDYAFTSTDNSTNSNEDWAFGRNVFLERNTYNNVTTPFNIRKAYVYSAVGSQNRFINTTPGFDSKLVPGSFLNGRLEGYFVDNLPNKKCRVGDRLKPLNVVDGDNYEWFVRASDQPSATAFVVSSGNIFTDVAHGLTLNTVIRLTGGSIPTPTIAGKDYFVKSIPSADTFTISEAVDGLELALTSTGSGNYQVQEFTPTWQSDIYDWLNRKQIVKHRWNGDGNNDTFGDPIDTMSTSDMVWSGTAAYATPPANKGEGKAFQVNGSSSYLTATTDEYADTEAFTVCGWVKLDTTTGTQCIVNARDTTGGWGLSQDAGILYLQTASATLTSSYGAELSSGVWAHIAIVFNDLNSALYVNGVQRAATFTADWVSASTHFLELGAISAYTTQYLDGELFDWRLYERVLTESQLLGLVNGPSFGGAPTLPEGPLLEDLGSLGTGTQVFNFNNGSGIHKKVIATGSIALQFVATKVGYYTALIEIDTAGSPLITYATTVEGVAPLIDTSDNALNIIPLFWDGATWYHV